MKGPLEKTGHPARGMERPRGFTGVLLALLLFAVIASPAVGEESAYDDVTKLLTEKKYEEALEEAEKILVDAELAAMPYFLKGQALHGLGRFAEAREACLHSRDLAEEGSDLAKAAVRNAATAEALRAEGNLGRGEAGEGAWHIFDEALRIDPGCSHALLRCSSLSWSLAMSRRNNSDCRNSAASTQT